MHSAARFQLATVASPATLMMASLESSTSAAMRCIRPYLTAGTRSSPGESIRSSRGAPESFDTARPRTISGLVISHSHVLIGINSMPAGYTPLPSQPMDFYARSNRTHRRMGIGVQITKPVPPHPDPRTVVDENRMGRPHEARTNPPAPRPEGCSNRDGGTEANRSRHDDAGTRGSKDDVRVVPGHVNHCRIQG